MSFEIIKTDQLLELLDRYKWFEMHLHHTWRPNHASFTGNNHIALQNAMERYHVQELKWDYIGQHLSLMPDGLWVTGRDLSLMPASIKGQNKVGSLAIEMVGDFDTGHDELKGNQKESILKLINYFIVKKKPIKFHNEYSDKTCPGSSIEKDRLLEEAAEIGVEEKSEWERILYEVLDLPDEWIDWIKEQNTGIAQFLPQLIVKVHNG